MSNSTEQTEVSCNNDNEIIINPIVAPVQDPFVQKINKNETNNLMKKLEAEGEKKLQVLQASNNLTVSNLTDIMEDGFSEFRKKTGRNPTYGEMRAMYG